MFFLSFRYACQIVNIRFLVREHPRYRNVLRWPCISDARRDASRLFSFCQAIVPNIYFWIQLIPAESKQNARTPQIIERHNQLFTRFFPVTLQGLLLPRPNWRINHPWSFSRCNNGAVHKAQKQFIVAGFYVRYFCVCSSLRLETHCTGDG